MDIFDTSRSLTSPPEEESTCTNNRNSVCETCARSVRSASDEASTSLIFPVASLVFSAMPSRIRRPTFKEANDSF